MERIGVLRVHHQGTASGVRRVHSQGYSPRSTGVQRVRSQGYRGYIHRGTESTFSGVQRVRSQGYRGYVLRGTCILIGTDVLRGTEGTFIGVQRVHSQGCRGYVLWGTNTQGLTKHSRETLEASAAATEKCVADGLAGAAVLTGVGHTGCDLRLTVPPGVQWTATAGKT